MAKGGARTGTGPKKGSKNKPRFDKFVDEKQVRVLIKKALEMAEAGDSIMLKFIMEQYFGKAPQSLELGGPDGKDLTIQMVNYGDVKRKVRTKTVSNTNK